MITAASSPPINLVQLARYTGGDAQLDAEVLELFAREATAALDQLEELLSSPDDKAWRDTAHRLKGAAYGVGAQGLGDAVARAEHLSPVSQPSEATQALGAAKARFRDVSAFLDAHLSR